MTDKYFTLGDVTGEIEVVGKARLMAAAWDNEEPVVVMLSGATTSLSAIRAKLNGCKERVRMQYSKSRSYQNTKIKASRPMQVLHTRDENIEEDHMLLLSDLMVNPQASDKVAYVLSQHSIAHPATSERSVLLLGQRIKQAVTIPVLQEWYKPLVEEGWRRSEIKKIDTRGCRVWSISMNQSWWEQKISTWLSQGYLEFPRQRVW